MRHYKSNRIHPAGRLRGLVSGSDFLVKPCVSAVSKIIAIRPSGKNDIQLYPEALSYNTRPLFHFFPPFSLLYNVSVARSSYSGVSIVPFIPEK